MKKLGLIGGTGPESTLVYYREINRLVNEKTGGKHFPEITIESIDLLKFVPMLNDGNLCGAADYLKKAAGHLADCGADIAAFTAVTCHMVYPQVSASSPIPLISIPETAAEYAKAMGYKKVGLLGTIYTMDNDYMSRPFLDCGIEVTLPNTEEKRLVSEKIYSELEYGTVKPETVAFLTSVIRRMKEEDGIEAVILGCTELPLAVNDAVSPVPCLDTVKIHIDKLVKLITE